MRRFGDWPAADDERQPAPGFMDRGDVPPLAERQRIRRAQAGHGVAQARRDHCMALSVDREMETLRADRRHVEDRGEGPGVCGESDPGLDREGLADSQRRTHPALQEGREAVETQGEAVRPFHELEVAAELVGQA